MYPYYESDWSILPPDQNRRFNQSLSIATIRQTINDTIERVRAPPPARLRELIRQIRTARTAAEERAIVNKECAFIRNAFREEDTVWRCRNMAKLLYIHMLGYPAHFGQLECLKLIASPKFTDKRIGYLGAMLLLDERQDVSLLITNCLKNDLANNIQFIVGLALCTLGAIASPEMAKDLAPDVEKLMKSSNMYIRKKAVLCAFRIVKRLPEHIEYFLPYTKTVLSEKNHAILITGITLITEICENHPQHLHIYRRLIIPSLIRMQKSLLLSGYTPDHDVGGISDPFLQVKILRLFRVLGRNDSDASDLLNDVLAQVATNTETTKNVGNSILYETVLTIMSIQSENSLRVLAINILGRFLLNSDKNIRYVALNSLMRTVQVDNTAVQRHRTTILECLKEEDITLQRRAMNLSFALINQQNVRIVFKELLLFLEKTEVLEFKATCSSQMVLAAENFAPTIRWHLDTLMNILVASGNYVRDDVVSSTIQLISNSPPEEQAHISTRLWKLLITTNSFEHKQALLKVAVWSIGEYGELFIYLNSDEIPTEEELVQLLYNLLMSNIISVTSKQYVILSLAKLSVRLQSSQSAIEGIMDSFRSHLDVDLQQRGIEFSQLFGAYEHLRTSLLEKMPIMKINSISPTAEDQVEVAAVVPSKTPVEQPIASAQQSNSSLLLDLLGGSSNDNNDNITGNMSTMTLTPSTGTNQDFLDLMGLSDLSIAAPANNNFSSSNNMMSGAIVNPNLSSDIFNDLLNDESNNNSIAANDMLAKSITILNKNNLLVEIVLRRDINFVMMEIITRNNSANNTLDQYLFQAAVPKSCSLEMFPPTNTTLLPNAVIKQEMRVAGSNVGIFKMKVRISYNLNGSPMLEQLDVNDFPPDMFIQ